MSSVRRLFKLLEKLPFKFSINVHHCLNGVVRPMGVGPFCCD